MRNLLSVFLVFLFLIPVASCSTLSGKKALSLDEFNTILVDQGFEVMPGLIGEDILNIETVPFDIAIKGDIYIERHQFSTSLDSKDCYGFVIYDCEQEDTGAMTKIEEMDYSKLKWVSEDKLVACI